MSFEKWQYEAGEMRRQERMLSGAVRRLMEGQMSRAWEQWQYVAGVMGAQRRALGMAMSRMVYGGWSSHVQRR